MKRLFLLSFCWIWQWSQAQAIELTLLGTAQDAGAPQVGCLKSCCQNKWETHTAEAVVALGVVDPSAGKKYLFEVTPDFPQQHHTFLKEEKNKTLDGIFVTHAHMGHYSGLMHLGKEAMGALGVPVFVMPKMRAFLANNGPWSQLVEEKNIVLIPLENQKKVELTEGLKVTPLRVPHRDEYSETVGFRIEGKSKTALFIPDIDKWEKWETNIDSLLNEVDFAFLDATFYDKNELPGRDLSAIPHPFVVESLERWKALPLSIKKKIYFIHFNHTNPLLDPHSEASKTVTQLGFNVARTGMKFVL